METVPDSPYTFAHTVAAWLGGDAADSPAGAPVTI